MPLKVACDRRDEARDQVKSGVHPSHQRQLDRIKQGLERDNTFEAIAKEWLGLKDWEQVTKDRRLGMLEREVFPSIGKLPVKQITSAHILAILKKTAKRVPTVAAEAKHTISGIFELAVSTLRSDTDPVYAVRKALPANKTQHKRPLPANESNHRGIQTHVAYAIQAE